MKKFAVALLLSVVTLALVGCGAATPATDTTTTPATDTTTTTPAPTAAGRRVPAAVWRPLCPAGQPAKLCPSAELRRPATGV